MGFMKIVVRMLRFKNLTASWWIWFIVPLSVIVMAGIDEFVD